MSLIGALTTTFKPPAPACFSTLIIEDPSNTWFQLGYPGSWADNDACLPPDWPRGPQYYYSPGVCPLGYQAGCHNTLEDRPGTRATCCPESYTCHPSVAINDTNFCGSLFTTTTRGTWPYLSYAQGADVPSKTTTTTSNDFGATIAASGIIIERQDGDPVWSTSSGGGGGSQATSSPATQTETDGGSNNTIPPTSSSSSSSSDSSSSLSGGAIAGIVIAVVAVLLIILGTAFLIARRKRRGKAAAAELPAHGNGAPPEGVPVYELPMEGSGGGGGVGGMDHHHQEPKELDEEGNRIHEFPGYEVKRAELQGEGRGGVEELDGSPVSGFGEGRGEKGR